MKPLAERFWLRVARRGHEECWLWTGARVSPSKALRYGVLGIDSSKRRREAHRVSWEVSVGPIPEGMCVLHRCDVPLCVNPSHLFLGTRGDNNRDRHAKGRTRSAGHPKGWKNPCHGARHPRAKCNAEMAVQILAMRDAGLTHAQLAANFGVGPTLINAVIVGTHWSQPSLRSGR